MYVTNPTVSPKKQPAKKPSKPAKKPSKPAKPSSKVKEEEGLSGGQIFGIIMLKGIVFVIGGPIGLGILCVLLVVGSFMESSNSRLIHLLFTEIFFTMEYRNFCSKASVQKFLCPIVQKNFCEKFL